MTRPKAVLFLLAMLAIIAWYIRIQLAAVPSDDVPSEDTMCIAAKIGFDCR